MGTQTCSSNASMSITMKRLVAGTCRVRSSWISSLVRWIAFALDHLVSCSGLTTMIRNDNEDDHDNDNDDDDLNNDDDDDDDDDDDVLAPKTR